MERRQCDDAGVRKRKSKLKGEVEKEQIMVCKREERDMVERRDRGDAEVKKEKE